MSNEGLAINGGQPLRSTELPAPYLGTALIGDEELELLTEVVRNRLPFRDYGDGTPHMVNDFEEEARKYFGVPYALATATGSGSIYCALAGLGVGPSDEIIIPSFGWYTDFEAPVLFGATPVFADIDRSLNMDPEDFERKITANTKAVMVVHFQGAAGDMDRICEIAKKHSITVIEDAAQACGADYKGVKVGSFGDIGCLSFQQNKIISTGDGGMLLAKNPIVFERAVRFHDLGFVRSALAQQLGGELKVEQFCSSQVRMNEFTGAVARAQLRKLDGRIIKVTRKLYWLIKEQLESKCSGIKFRKTGDEQGDAGIALYIDFENQERADWFKKALPAEGIRVGPSSGCCNLLHEKMVLNKVQVHPDMPPFGKGWPGENVLYSPELCPKTDDILASLECVAITPAMTEKDAQDVADAIIKIWPFLP